MLENSLYLVAVLFFAMALTALIRINTHNPAILILVWLFSWLGQSFAPQLALISLVLSIYFGITEQSNGHEALLFNGALALFFLADTVLFAWVYWAGQKNQPIVDSVIDAAIDKLNSGKTTRNSHQIASQTTNQPTVSGLRPFNFRRSGIQVTKNVCYWGADEAHNDQDARFAGSLDIYQPLARPSKPMPILIQVPGGAWVTGNKNQQGLPLLHHMASLGWTCFSINYRLAPKHRFPAMLEDVLRAIAWVKSHANEYGADAEFVAITGGSAGGHLISLAALIPDKQAFQPGFEEFNTNVNVVVSMYGRYDFLNRHGILPGTGLEPFLSAKVMPGTPKSYPELWELASPVGQVQAKAPPFLVIHGHSDALIPVEEAREFVKALEQVSDQAVDYVELPMAQHAFDLLCTNSTMPTIYAIARYLQAHYQHSTRNNAQSQEK